MKQSELRRDESGALGHRATEAPPPFVVVNILWYLAKYQIYTSGPNIYKVANVIQLCQHETRQGRPHLVMLSSQQITGVLMILFLCLHVQNRHVN